MVSQIDTLCTPIAPQSSLDSDIENGDLHFQHNVTIRSQVEPLSHKRKGREDDETPSTNAGQPIADQRQDDVRPSGKRQKYCNDRSPNISETWNGPTYGQYASHDSHDQTHKMVRSLEETLDGPEKEIYEKVKRRIQVFTYCEHAFSLKESMIAEWWTEAAEKLKDDQPNAKIGTTVTKSILKSLYQIYYRPRKAFFKFAKLGVMQWYGLGNLKRHELRKKINFLLDKERYVCPQDYYQTPQSYYKGLALPSLLRARYKKKTKSDSGLQLYHTEGRAPLFLATILHQALEDAKGDRPSKKAEEIYDQHLATWENTSRIYQDSVNQELRVGVERMQRLKDMDPRKELSDPHAIPSSSA